MDYEQVVSLHMNEQQRRAELSEEDKKLFEKIEEVDPGAYDATSNDMRMIAYVFNNNAINAFGVIFKYGFLKGQRAEKARRRKSVRK